MTDSKLYLDHQTFGFTDLIGATKARCADLGVELRAPSPAERARALAEHERFARETEQLIRSSAQPMYDAAALVFSGLAARLAQIQQGTGWIIETGSDVREFVAFVNGRSLQLAAAWSHATASAELSVRIFSGRVLTPEQKSVGRRSYEEPTESDHERFALTRLPGPGWCWTRDDGREFTSDGLAEHAANEFVSALGQPDDNSAEVLGRLFSRRR